MTMIWELVGNSDSQTPLPEELCLNKLSRWSLCKRKSEKWRADPLLRKVCGRGRVGEGVDCTRLCTYWVHRQRLWCLGDERAVWAVLMGIRNFHRDDV